MDKEKYTLDYSIISKRVKEARKAMNLTQSALSELINVNTNTIAKLESNCTTISLQTMIKLANTLGIDINYLLINEENNQEMPLNLLINSIVKEFDNEDKELLLAIITAMRSYKKKKQS